MYQQEMLVIMWKKNIIRSDETTNKTIRTKIEIYVNCIQRDI